MTGLAVHWCPGHGPSCREVPTDTRISVSWNLHQVSRSTPPPKHLAGGPGLPVSPTGHCYCQAPGAPTTQMVVLGSLASGLTGTADLDSVMGSFGTGWRNFRPTSGLGSGDALT